MLSGASPDAAASRGLAAEAAGRPDEAVVHFRRALARDPAHAAALLGMGRALAAAGRLEEAQAACHRALALGSADAQAFALLADVLCRQGSIAEATACLAHAVEIAPGEPELNVRLGALYEIGGNPEAAADCYHQALEASPPPTCRRRAAYRIGVLRKRTGGIDAARAWLERVVAEDPDHRAAGHMLAALRGETTGRAPAEYVRDLFDTFAPVFDRLMTEGLAYAAPRRLEALMAECLPVTWRAVHAVDLGCGTGLAGAVLRPRADHLEGIDLSAASLRLAAAKGVYDRLSEADITAVLAGGRPERFELALAADVLNYFGDLAPPLQAVGRALRPGGWLFASVESATTAPYRLGISGRYRHHPDYVRRTAAAAGLHTVADRPAALRQDGGRPVDGRLFALQRSPTTAPRREENP